MLGTPELDKFISEQRWAVVTTLRGSGQPSSSVVAYAREADELVISTPGKTFKVRTLEQDPRVSVCVFDEAQHPSFVTLEGTVEIQREDLKDATQKVFANLASTGFRPPADLDTWLRDQERVILRVRPQRVSGVLVPKRR